MGHGLHAVQSEKRLRVERIDRKTVGILDTDKVAIVLRIPFGPGMGTAC